MPRDPDDDDDHERLCPEALSICAYATVAQLKADCLEVSKLYAELSEPDRARMLALLFGADG